MEPLPEKTLASDYPLAWAYLNIFKTELQARRGFAGWERHIHEKYFYALQRIGDYTFKPYKVCWRFIASAFLPVVVGPADDPYLGEVYPIPNDKVVYVGLDDGDEAYYLCGLLRSS